MSASAIAGRGPESPEGLGLKEIDQLSADFYEAAALWWGSLAEGEPFADFFQNLRREGVWPRALARHPDEQGEHHLFEDCTAYGQALNRLIKSGCHLASPLEFNAESLRVLGFDPASSARPSPHPTPANDDTAPVSEDAA